MDSVGVGIIGSKFAGDFHCDSYQRHPSARLVAVASPTSPKTLADKWHIPHIYLDYHDLLRRDDIQLVSICAPNSMHHELTVAAAKAGKHILCEKPLATSVEDGQAMLDACRKHGVKLFYAEDWVFAPALKRVSEIVAEGGIGDVLYVKAKEVHSGTHSPYAKNAETCGGGSLIHLAVHPVAWILHFLSDSGKNPVREVIGKTNAGAGGNFVHKDNGGEDWALGVMTFQNGQQAFVEGNYITVGGMDDKVEIYGTEGVIKADLSFGSPLSVYSRPGYEYGVEKADNTLGWTKPAVDEFYNLGYAHEMGYAVDCVLNNTEPMYSASGELGLQSLRIIDAMYRSNREGKTIEI